MLTTTNATQLCISLSSNPGKFGSLVHNAAYRALGIDFIYKPCFTNNIKEAIAGVRALGIRGCSISMPFKESVIAYLDSLDPVAKEVGAVNTIINQNNHLKGFNTDVSGVYSALAAHLLGKSESILILGAGGMAKAIVKSLQLLGQTDITICVRNELKNVHFLQERGIKVIKWDNLYQSRHNILINATPIGMDAIDTQQSIDISSLENLQLVIDVVVKKTPTQLIQDACNRNLKVVDGISIALFQAYDQFEIYTNRPAPREVMSNAILTM